MCIMLTKPADVKLNKRALHRCFDGNPDGAGFACASNGVVHIHKQHTWDFEELWDQLIKFEHLPMLIHFRFATEGGLTYANTHPFLIKTKDKDIEFAMAHNGIFKIRTFGNKSDTVTMIDSFIQPAILKDTYAMSKASFAKKIDNYDCGWSRMAFMDNLGNFYYYNFNLGVSDMGCWWSNDGYVDNRQRGCSNSAETITELNTMLQERADAFSALGSEKSKHGIFVLRSTDLDCYICDCPVDPKEGFLIEKSGLNVCCATCWKDFIGEDINAPEVPEMSEPDDQKEEPDFDGFAELDDTAIEEKPNGVIEAPDTSLPDEILPAEAEYAVLPSMLPVAN